MADAAVIPLRDEPAPRRPRVISRPPIVTEERDPVARVSFEDLLGAVRAAAQRSAGTDWELQLAGFLAFLRRRLVGDYEVDQYGFDHQFQRQVSMALLRPLAEYYFRVEVRGAQHVPTEGGALIVSNHSGTLPFDAAMTSVVVHDHVGRDLRMLGADLVFRLPFIGSAARASGATLACQEDAERMLRDGELVGVWPEGFKGIGKPFSERYQLQRFGRGGFVSAAMRCGAPIVPLAVVGAEETYPMLANVPALARLLGIPYLPITPTFPLLGPLGLLPLPSKWLLEFGEPIETETFGPAAADDPALAFNLNDQVREMIQHNLYVLLRDRASVFG